MARIAQLPENTANCTNCHDEQARWLVTGAPERPELIRALCNDCVHDYVRDKWWQE